MSIAIKVENLSKAYQLGEIGTGTISRDLERWVAKARGKEDPFLKIGEENDRATKGTSNAVWSLKDINFEIEQGDAVGIIGRNGAGKSTLLKILSRVTSPTTGKITGKGRIASLLEVGTGFHPELTGRENIFLNGAILGMRKKEIARKFDEIVDFSGVERYIDTPVKRYSSGMYVRLAFAVAAYLESEILIVDEVLAVGDAEFQKKCLGKMNEVSKGEGRTVLFVSHNLGAIQQLCNKAILIQLGSIEYSGSVEAAINKYAAKTTGSYYKSSYINYNSAYIKEAYFINIQKFKINNVNKGESFGIRFHIINPEEKKLELQISVWNTLGNKIWNFKNSFENEDPFPSKTEIMCDILFTPPYLNMDQLLFHFALNYFMDEKNELLDHQINALKLDLIENKIDQNNSRDTIFKCPYKLNIN